MTIETFLASAGHYLLYAVGFILLFIFIVLALAFIFTLFIKIGFDFSAQIRNAKVKKDFLIYLKLPFYRLIIFETDDDISETALDFSELGEDDSVDENESEKFVCHVTFENENITAEMIKPEKYGNGYEVVIHLNETKNSTDESEYLPELSEIRASAKDENKFIAKSENKPKSENSNKLENTSEFKTKSKSDDFENNKFNDDESEDDESDDFDFSDFYDLHDFSFSDVFEELVKYVDLSDPVQFASDTVSAASKVSNSVSRFLLYILIRSNIQELSLNTIYGLSDPADTAVSYGTIQSFNASVYAYLLEVQNKSHSSRKRKRAKQLSAHLKDDIFIVPDLTQKELEADTDMDFSVWLPYLYFPTLRFLLTKNTRWFVSQYVYKYYIRQYLKTKETERKEKRKAKKEQKSKEYESETN